MAQLIKGRVNVFKEGVDNNVISQSAPSGSVGIDKNVNSDETGFYLYTKKSFETTQDITVWMYYHIGGWQEFMTISGNDDSFNDGYVDGAVIPWTVHETHGSPQKAFFQTAAGAEVRLFVNEGNFHVDFQPGGSDFDRQFVSFDGDTSLAGGLTNDHLGYFRVDHDLTGYAPGDLYTTVISVGAVDDVVSFIDRFKQIQNTWEYDGATGDTTISFTVPDVKNNISRFHSYVSLATIQSGSGGQAAPITNHTGMTFTVRVGDDTISDGSLEFLLCAYGSFKVEWGDGDVDDYVNVGNITNFPRHTYASAGDYQIKIADATNFKITHHTGTGHWANNYLQGSVINSRNYVLADDTNNDGPIALGKYAELAKDHIDGVTSWTASGSTMTIVDPSGFRWDQFFTGANRAGVGTTSWLVYSMGQRSAAPVQSASYDASTSTSTIVLEYGRPLYNNSAAKVIEEAGDLCQQLNSLNNLILLENVIGNSRIYYGPDSNYTGSWFGNGWDAVKNVPFYFSRDMGKWISIDQWGDLSWTAARWAFYLCKNLDILATDSPQWQNCTHLGGAFYGCSSLVDANNSLNNISVCHDSVTSMGHNNTNHGMFGYCSLYNPDNLNQWDTSGCKNFSYLFYGASAFNGDISSWVINTDYSTTNAAADAVDMRKMFELAISFNGDINTKLRSDGVLAWDTKGVTDMVQMFRDAHSFNSSINNWNTSNVEDAYAMFHGAEGQMIYNQPMNTALVNVGGNSYVAWDTLNIKSFSYMFANCRLFNQDISYWNTSSTTSLYGMFINARQYNQDMNTQAVTVNGNTYTAWDTLNVQSMEHVFHTAVRFNRSVENWNTDSVIGARQMFFRAYSYNQPMNRQSVTVNGSAYEAWNLSQCSDMFRMFAAAILFNQPIGNWNVSSMEKAGRMFDGAYAFNQDLSGWGQNGDGTSSLQDAHYMFKAMRSMTYGNSFSTWNVNSLINGNYMFACTNFGSNGNGLLADSIYENEFGTLADITTGTSYNITDPLDSNNTLTYTRSTFIPDVSTWVPSSLKHADSMFVNQSPSFDVDFSLWDTSSLENAVSMFNNCHGFTGQGLNNWDVSSLIDMRMMFRFNWALGENFTNWDVSKVENFQGAFRECYNFVGSSLSQWQPVSATTFNTMFYKCYAFNGNLSQWPTSSQLKNVANMFRYCGNYNQDMAANPNANVSVNGYTYGIWDLSGVTNFQAFLANTGSFNGSVANWDFASAKTCGLMIRSSAFDQSLGSWKNIDKILTFSFSASTSAQHVGPIFGYSTIGYPNTMPVLSTANYDDTLIGWAATLQAAGGSDLGTWTGDDLGVTPNHVPAGDKRVAFGNSKHTSAAQSARDYLTNTLGWTILDHGLV